MKKQEFDILKVLLQSSSVSQKKISEKCGVSVGAVNSALKNLKKYDFLDNECRLTPTAQKHVKKNAPVNAIILAAGFGMRMIPINKDVPKALIEVHGEPLIERVIRQLHDRGVKKVFVVVGFMKERFEYLIDKYGVELVINTAYAKKNNLHSLAIVLRHISNSYIVPCDIWCKENPFDYYEPYSWYMVTPDKSVESSVRINRKKELVPLKKKETGNSMLGIAYVTAEDSSVLKTMLKQMDCDYHYDSSFWEDSLVACGKKVYAREAAKENCVEINTYEQLREFDNNSLHLQSDAIAIAARALHVSVDDITNIEMQKKGMTNKSFLFSCKKKKYIMRIPGEGTDLLINRQNEAFVFAKMAGRGICDEVVYINPENGYKITKFLNAARPCNAYKIADLKRCMQKLREFHNMKIQVEHSFDLFFQIEFYENLRKGAASVFIDYDTTKRNVLSLKPFVESLVTERCLTHIDAVADNFLFSKNASGESTVSLIDWEYAGMQDPHVDLAMFCIYSYYNKKQVDRLLDIYFEKKCTNLIRIKVYAYMSICGLLWSNWCEYKSMLGVEFGEYHLYQYHYAKEFYTLVQKELARLNMNKFGAE